MNSGRTSGWPPSPSSPTSNSQHTRLPMLRQTSARARSSGSGEAKHAKTAQELPPLATKNLHKNPLVLHRSTSLPNLDYNIEKHSLVTRIRRLSLPLEPVQGQVLHTSTFKSALLTGRRFTRPVPLQRHSFSFCTVEEELQSPRSQASTKTPRQRTSKGPRGSAPATAPAGLTPRPLRAVCQSDHPHPLAYLSTFGNLRKHNITGYSIDIDGEDYLQFKEGTKKNAMCMAMDDKDLLQLALTAELFEFEAGEDVVSEGEPGTHFFVVKSGCFSVREKADASSGSEIGPGDSFGEISLVHNCTQWSTVSAKINGSCWGVERSAFRRASLQLAERVYQENMSLLGSVAGFQYLDKLDRAMLCRSLMVQIFLKGSDVMKEGSEDRDCLFIVKSGVFEVKVGAERVTTLGVGEVFGERALLYKCPRTATVTALEPSMVLVGRKILFEKAFRGRFLQFMWRDVIHISLRQMRDSEEPSQRLDMTGLADLFVTKEFAARSVIIKHESEARGLRFMIILDGSVLIRKGGQDGKKFHRGDWFGREYIDDSSKHFEHVVENTEDEPCRLAFLSADALTALPKPGAAKIELSYRQKIALVRKIYIFKNLPNDHCGLIANSCRALTTSKGDSVIKEGEMGSQFFVIISGELVVTLQGRSIRTLGATDYFGERGLLYDEPRTATVTCLSSAAELLVIDKAVFMHIVGGKMLQHLEERICLQQTNVAFKDLHQLRILGTGTYGVVKLVEHRVQKTQYALKCIRRAEAAKSRQQAQALKLEREILLENDHPFIVQVVRTFKDSRYLYFLTELVNGGELYSTIRKLGLLNRCQAQFYVGSLILALDSLHERNIAFRDLKPENVLLDSQGFIKLIDFGCASKLRGLSYTIVGTPHYMAPEVILGAGYGLACDIWSLGVCLYEFLCGPLPFANDSDDPNEILKEVVTGTLRIPEHIVDPSTISVLKQLLRKSFKKRLGCGRGGRQAMHHHEFFSDFNFDALLVRQVEPPLVPFCHVHHVNHPVGDSASEAESGFSTDSDQDSPRNDLDDCFTEF